ncbi:hypothetical protein WOLCODRAFT_160444 [Wolfiporia cocos MD-104 SS10]|uniref:DNA replication regulator SLD2 n=1 Tax=Wolfiporia cocos (strain MD-104) TaxID=742152 RepID=A0A2H3IVA5_WOLCO|nr:hypothetical protein WOLCODRAFT_160444 [Wolfiporia cocos MD-104 SS10]
MDIASLRAEIKAWERDFRSQHARDPTVQEIKARPEIAAKYKLYKSLTKSSTSAQATRPSDTRPSTPPRSQPRQAAAASTSSLLTKSRAVKVDPPSQTTNPFSPVKKNRLIHNDSDHTNLLLKPSQRASNINPFTTPTKPKARSKPKPSAPARTPSPDLFPPIKQTLPVQSQPVPSQSNQNQVPVPAPQTPATKSAVTRARKRLRGEPVSPSPIKEKRARVSLSTQRSPHLGRAFLVNDGDGEEKDADTVDETLLAATPMKPPPGGRAFRLLFDEVLPDAQGAHASRPPPTRTFSRAQSGLPKQSQSQLGKKRARSRAASPPASSSDEEEASWENGAKLKDLITSANERARAGGSYTMQKKLMNASSKHAIPRSVLPGRDDLRSEAGPASSKTSSLKGIAAPDMADVSDTLTRSAVKRPLPDEQAGEYESAARNDVGDSAARLHRLPLLPPSPPPPDSSSSKPHLGSAKDKGKGKAAAAFSRKKARLLEQTGEDADDSADEDDARVRVVEHSWHSRKPQPRYLVDADEDTEWDWPPYPVHPPDSPTPPEGESDSGKVEVHLPDDLRRILSISTRSDTTKDEERLVRGLLYGRREFNYDAKGGEIWDVGEAGEDTGGAGNETEQDWEGEPVPWEVGEL